MTVLAEVIEIEKYLKQLPDEVEVNGQLIKTQRELKVEHHFSFGVYARILYIPADTILTGKLHRYPQINLLRQGVVSVLVGDKIKKLKAPQIIAYPGGVKRIFRSVTDAVWITIHGTQSTDLAEIENTFIVSNELEYLKQKLI